MRNDDVARVVAEVVASVLPGGRASDPQASLTEQGLDSVGMVRLLSALEQRFGLSIPPGDITPDNFASVEALAALMGRLAPP